MQLWCCDDTHDMYKVAKAEDATHYEVEEVDRYVATLKEHLRNALLNAACSCPGAQKYPEVPDYKCDVCRAHDAV